MTELALVVANARVMTCDRARPGLGLIDHGALAVDGDGKIAWVGEDAERPRGASELDAGGRLVTPGLVDCHTHAIFAGDRANEFALRAAGKTYVEIQDAGGGIMATLAPTRAAPDAVLARLLHQRIQRMVAGGTTTLEVKSGYDLTYAGEVRLLEIVRWCNPPLSKLPRLVPTLLAHLVPPERRADRDALVREICEQWIPRVSRDPDDALLGPDSLFRPRLASSVDVWCESNAFTLAETRAIFAAAQAHGLAVRGHIGQLSDLGAAELLGEASARSADHLEYISDAGIAALARAGTVAVMLPGACVQLRLPPPPIDKLRAAGVAMAVATDLNPGSSYCETLPVQMWLATTHFGMTVDEAWLGVTRHAARALDVPAGVLAAGQQADLVLWNAEQPSEIPYRYGTSQVDRVFIRGLDAIAK